MSSNKADLVRKIDEIDNKLSAQLESISGMRGVHEDVVRMMVPAMKDQINLLREIVAHIPE